MAKDLLFSRPAKKEDIAKSSIIASSNADMQPALHEIRPKMANNRPARIILHIMHHCLPVPLIQADGIIIIGIEERPRFLREGGIILQALLGREIAQHLAVPKLITGRSLLGRFLLIDHAWLLSKKTTLRLAACNLKTPNHFSQMAIHSLLNREHPMPMIRHDCLGEEGECATLGALDGCRLFPFLLHCLAEGRENDLRMERIGTQRSQKRPAVGYNERDQIDAGLIIVMSGIMRAIWKGKGVDSG